MVDSPESFRSEKYGSNGLGSAVNIKVFAHLLIVAACAEVVSIVGTVAFTEYYELNCSTMTVKLVNFVLAILQLAQILLLLTIMIVCISFRIPNIAVQIVLIVLVVCVSMAQLHDVKMEWLTLLTAIVSCVFVALYCWQIVNIVDCVN